MKRTSEDFPLDNLSSAQWPSAMLTGKVTLFASGNKAEIANVNKADGKRIVDILRARLSAPPAPAGVSEAPAGPVEQIRKLAELRDAGILSSEEFEDKKPEILSRI
jgi:hypothetical protein